MDRIRFEHIEAFWLLLILIPILLGFLWFLLYRRQALSRMGVDSLVARLSPDRPQFKHQVKFILASLAVALLITALANLQTSQKKEKVNRKGIDLMVAVDISRSMLAEDEKPNRLSRARQFVSRLVDELAGDRVGLIIFAGNAYLQVPLTSDYLAARTFLKTINTDLAATQGTAIGDAIDLAEESFKNGQLLHKAVLIISDGENHEGNATTAARTAAENGTVIHTLGIGSSKGSPIPEYRNGKQVDFKRDREGSIVFSKLNESMLKEVAEAGNGRYFKLSDGFSEVRQIREALATMEQQEFEAHVFTDYEDNFQIFLAIGLLLIILEFFISERRSELLSDWKIFKS